MALRINSNESSLFAFTQLQNAWKSLNNSLTKLSSGRRINKAADDASGMAIANSLQSQMRGYGQAIKNANDAISVVQVADGAMGEATNIIMDIRTKAIQAAQDGQSLESRQALQADVNRSLEALDQIAKNTSFNGQKLLSGDFTNKTFQLGAFSGKTVNVSIGSIEPSQMGGLSDVDLTTQEGAQAAISSADAALEELNQQRSSLGSTQNQVASTIENLSTAMVNVAAAESEIADVDFAEESMVFSKMKNLFKARMFSMTQANKMNQNNIMSLLQGE